MKTEIRSFLGGLTAVLVIFAVATVPQCGSGEKTIAPTVPKEDQLVSGYTECRIATICPTGIKIVGSWFPISKKEVLQSHVHREKDYTSYLEYR